MKTIAIFYAFLFCLNLQAQKAPLNISITDFENIPLSGEQVLFVDMNSKNVFKGVSDANGLIKMEIPAGKYEIKLKSVGEAEDFSTFEVPSLGPNESYQTASMQIQIQETKAFTLDNLNFESGKWSIEPTSFQELDELVEFMRLKKTVKIEIAGHTDNEGESSANLTLSQKRADAVKAYLVSKGISAKRISAVGYGEEKPIADNTSPQGKAQNRRTEVKVLN